MTRKEAASAQTPAPTVFVVDDDPDIREALDSLGEITGKTMDGEILDRIFSSFCIGK